MNFICFNGEILPGQNLFTPENRGFRYGDGVFETIKVFRGKILLEEFHFDRLFSSLALLKLIASNNFTREKLVGNILDLCAINKCLNSARVRLAIFRGKENKAEFVIEAIYLEEGINQLNEEGWKIEIYPLVRKSCDAFANLKSANYLPYVLADLYAKEMGCQESIVLNTYNNLCDASKANIFFVVKDEVYTPALHQGCVNGVKRRFVIDELKKEGFTVYQREVNEELLLGANEVFLTNAITDIRWVKAFRNKTYGNTFTKEFYKKNFLTVYR
jgi:branched-chain amino acid aminotransferase